MFKNKSFLVLVAFVTIIYISLEIFGYGFLRSVGKKEINASLKRDMAISLAAIDPERIRAIGESYSDSDENFYRLRVQFLKLQEQFGGHDNIDSVYSMKKNGETIEFLVDSTPIGDPDYGPPGDPYLDPPYELYSVFLNGHPAFVGPYTDEYGTFYSYFVPIVDFTSGEAVGVMGIDIETDYYNALVRTRFLYLSLISSIVYALSLFLLVYTKKLAISRRKLNKQKKMMEDLIDALPDIFYLLDQDGKFLLWNKSLPKVLGLDEKKMAEKTFSGLFSGQDRKKIEDSFKAAYKTGRDVVVIKTKSKKNGFMLELSHVLMKDLDGEIIGIAGDGHDISARYAKEEELARQRAELEKLNSLMVGRENKMIELKKELNKLQEQH